MEQPVTLIVPEGVKFSDTRSVNGKRMAVYFTNDETKAFQFAREYNGHHYKFMPETFRILIPVKES